MKITRRAADFSKSVRETILPAVSGSRKSGALVPRGNIVELTAAMAKIWSAPGALSNSKDIHLRFERDGGRATNDETDYEEPGDEADLLKWLLVHRELERGPQV